MDPKKIAEIAVKKESELTDENLVIRRADQVDGLEVNDDGSIESLEGDDKEIISDLIDNFKEMMGDVAANLIAQEMKKNDVEKSEIPEELSDRY